ncbi:MAG: class I SAM-dependent methyltransferase [Verrucomicrobia bacterium]|nr:class I SAM-dependent methyltransferase [Verrucomicrobiota bacterium]
MTWLQTLPAWFRRAILRDRAARWNHQYASGRWERLKAPQEAARLDACATLLRRHVPGGRLLEIGCGEALLQQRLASGDFSRFVGVDISAVAIERARVITANDPRVTYLTADMRELELAEKFDAVIFTESIYYVPDPAAVLRRYARLLDPDGVFVVSIFQNKRGAEAWAQIHPVTTVVDRTTTTNAAGSWDCEVLRLR